MIREATTEDLPDIVAMLARLRVASGSLGNFDQQAAYETASRIIDDGVIFRSDRGLFAGRTMAAPNAPSWLMAYEIWWWSEDGQWLPLLRKFEGWAKERGAGEVRMSSTIGPVSTRLVKVFRRAGYEPREICYRKVL